jgi:hypothetical protein
MSKFYIECSTEVEADLLSKILAASRQATLAGLLGANYTIKAVRRDGGKVRVYVEGEAAALDAFKQHVIQRKE